MQFGSEVQPADDAEKTEAEQREAHDGREGHEGEAHGRDEDDEHEAGAEQLGVDALHHCRYCVPIATVAINTTLMHCLRDCATLSAASAAASVATQLLNQQDLLLHHCDYVLVYALLSFQATLEGQVCVLKGDPLALLDHSNSYWWLVRCCKTDEIGYIPAENIETPNERTARLNRIINVKLALATDNDLDLSNTLINDANISSNSSNLSSLMDYDTIDSEPSAEPDTTYDINQSQISTTKLPPPPEKSSRSISFAADPTVFVEYNLGENYSDEENDYLEGESDDDNDNLDNESNIDIKSPVTDEDGVLSVVDSNVRNSMILDNPSTTAAVTATTIGLNFLKGSLNDLLNSGGLGSSVSEESDISYKSGSIVGDGTSSIDGSNGKKKSGGSGGLFWSRFRKSSTAATNSDISPPKTPSVQAKESPSTTRGRTMKTFTTAALTLTSRSTSATRSPSPPSARKSVSTPSLTTAPSPPCADNLPIPTNSLQPIRVLRIYTGNFDLSATFKSVSWTRETTVEELLRDALKRFKVPIGTKFTDEFYLSVLHFESQERRLPNTENVYNLLESLSAKRLPGLSTTSKPLKLVEGSSGGAVLVQDDQIIKILINKNVNDEIGAENIGASIRNSTDGGKTLGNSSPAKLVRIFKYGDCERVRDKEVVRTVKTVSVDGCVTIGGLLELLCKKFKVDCGSGEYEIVLESVCGSRETVCNLSDNVHEILKRNQDGQSDFIFQRQQQYSSSNSSKGSSEPPTTLQQSIPQPKPHIIIPPPSRTLLEAKPLPRTPPPTSAGVLNKSVLSALPSSTISTAPKVSSPALIASSLVVDGIHACGTVGCTSPPESPMRNSGDTKEVRDEQGSGVDGDVGGKEKAAGVSPPVTPDRNFVV